MHTPLFAQTRTPRLFLSVLAADHMPDCTQILSAAFNGFVNTGAFPTPGKQSRTLHVRSTLSPPRTLSFTALLSLVPSVSLFCFIFHGW